MKSQATAVGHLEAEQAERSLSAVGTRAVVLSFDIEEHDRIEAAAGLEVDAGMRRSYRKRMVNTTGWLLDTLAQRGIRATFFVVGEIAEYEAALVRRIVVAGHEVGSHGHVHRSLLRMTPEEFRADLRRSKYALEQATQVEVVGFRAPTFSLVSRTAWALDILAEEGFRYDSSIYPVRHDRYGVPDAPRGPFLARGHQHEMLELPPASMRIGRVNLPIGGGGYFRLMPGSAFRAALNATCSDTTMGRPVLYFHPWEFDPGQPRLPLRPLSRWRTYVGIARGRRRLSALLNAFDCGNAIDTVSEILKRIESLPRFSVDPASRDNERSQTCRMSS